MPKEEIIARLKDVIGDLRRGIHSPGHIAVIQDAIKILTKQKGGDSKFD